MSDYTYLRFLIEQSEDYIMFETDFIWSEVLEILWFKSFLENDTYSPFYERFAMKILDRSSIILFKLSYKIRYETFPKKSRSFNVKS